MTPDFDFDREARDIFTPAKASEAQLRYAEGSLRRAFEAGAKEMRERAASVFDSRAAALAHRLGGIVAHEDDVEAHERALLDAAAIRALAEGKEG